MEKDGLSVQEEPVKVPCWVRGKEHVSLLSPREKNIPIAGLGRSVGTPNGQPLTAKVLVVSSFEELDSRNSEAKGKASELLSPGYFASQSFCFPVTCSDSRLALGRPNRPFQR